MATPGRYEMDVLKTLKRIAVALEKIEKQMRKDQSVGINTNENEEETTYGNDQ